MPLLGCVFDAVRIIGQIRRDEECKVPVCMMLKFRSVKIIHDVFHRIDFSYLAEFFRFMGILVCEEILSDLEQDASKTGQHNEYSASIYVGDRTIGADKLMPSEEEYRHCVSLLPSETIFLYEGPVIGGFVSQAGINNGQISKSIINNLTLLNQQNVLKELMNRVLEKVFATAEEGAIAAAQLDDIIDIYVNQKLWFHSLNLQYYAKKKSLIVSKAKEAFLKAHNDMKKLMQIKYGSAQYLYDYAALWCEYKTNTACDYNREVLYFLIEKLVGRCRELISQYPDFTNAKILLGLCYEPFPNSVNEAVDAFSAALEDIKDECFSSPVYYWIGKRNEPYRDKKKEVELSYKLANSRKVKFRNIFKLAIIERDREEYDSALEKFESIAGKLCYKRELKFTDPLELEYLFKIYTQECFICHEKKEYLEAIVFGGKALKVREEEVPVNCYFDAFYGVAFGGQYRDALRERLRPKAVYELLLDCYIRIGDDENAKKYRNALKEIYREEEKSGV